MTIIAVKDGVVAWDSLITHGSMRWGNISDKMVKIVKRKRPYVIGGCGDLHEIQMWKRMITGMDDDDFLDFLRAPMLDRHTKSTPVLYDPRKRLLYEGSGKIFTTLRLHNANYATGTGEQYAYGLMDAGKDAISTVRMVCCKFDCCGLPVRSIDTSKFNDSTRGAR